VLKKKLASIGASVEPEKEWWEQKRASVKEGFMRELDQDESKRRAAVAGPKMVETTTPAGGDKESGKVGRGQRSDESEEAVLVETPAQAAAVAAVDPVGGGGGGGAAGGAGKGKKKKGKK